MKALADSFLSVSFAANVIVTGFKVSEDGEGYILRMWECEGQETAVVINLSRLGAQQAWRCDLLEKIVSPLDIEDGMVHLTIPARGLKAIKFV